MSEKILKDFRDLKINRTQLNSLIENISSPLKIERKDLKFVLEQYVKNKITQDKLLDWVNTIWTSDFFEYKDSDAECLASIMHILEELDESDSVLSKEKALEYIDALNKNKILSFYANI